MKKVVGVSVTHKIRLSLVTDEGFGEDYVRHVGLKTSEVEIDGNFAKIVGMDGADWLQLLGCEVNFGCHPLMRYEALLLGYDPDDKSMHYLIDKVIVTKKPTEGTPEQEDPAMSNRNCRKREKSLQKLLFQLRDIDGKVSIFVQDEIRMMHPDEHGSITLTSYDTALIGLSGKITDAYVELNRIYHREYADRSQSEGGSRR